jgi:glycosyltransferase involved in cell wall biosynthesis
MLEGARLVVVVPAFEEAPRLGRTLSTLPGFVDDIIVVDDASSDETANVAEKCRDRDRRIWVVRHEINRGVGAAIVTGYRAASKIPGTSRDAFVVMAGDGQMDPKDLPRVALPIARGEADYVKGDRHRSKSRNEIPIARRVVGEILSHMTSLAIGQKISDSQCGFTAISRAACTQLDLSSIYPRFGYPNDLLGALAIRKMKITEVEVRAIYADEESKLRAWHVPKIAQLTLRAGLRRMIRLETRTSGSQRPLDDAADVRERVIEVEARVENLGADA